MTVEYTLDTITCVFSSVSDIIQSIRSASSRKPKVEYNRTLIFVFATSSRLANSFDASSLPTSFSQRHLGSSLKKEKLRNALRAVGLALSSEVEEDDTSVVAIE
jgi:hypothetical protein